MSETGSTRRRPLGGYPRGDETRGRILTAAIRVFGAEGYERASTREIAAAAEVRTPALQYHFDSKEGLHRACAELIISRVREVLGPVLRDGEAAVGGGDAQRAAASLCDVLDAIADLYLNTSKTADWRRFLTMVQTDGAGPAHAIVQEGLMRPLNAACAALVGVVIGRPPSSETTRLHSVLVLGQLSALHMSSESSLAALGWREFDKEGLSKVKATLRAHTLAALASARASGDA